MRNRYKKLIGHKFVVHKNHIIGADVEYTFGDFIDEVYVRIEWDDKIKPGYSNYRCEEVISMIKNDIWVVNKSYQREQKLKRLLK